MDVVILAGGRATRLGRVEKGLLTFMGRTLLDIAVDAALDSGVGPILVAVSPHTPRTAAYAKSCGLRVLETAGIGYHEDVKSLLEERRPFLSLAVDLPFVRGRHIAALAEAYRGRSLAGALPAGLLPADAGTEGVPDDEWRGLAPVGINVVDRSEFSCIFLFDDPLLAYNVNTLDDLKRAEGRARSLGRVP
jgi:adenosylcobinamide-phosphate guanylyltransferase